MHEQPWHASCSQVEPCGKCSNPRLAWGSSASPPKHLASVESSTAVETKSWSILRTVDLMVLDHQFRSWSRTACRSAARVHLSLGPRAATGNRARDQCGEQWCGRLSNGHLPAFIKRPVSNNGFEVTSHDQNGPLTEGDLHFREGPKARRSRGRNRKDSAGNWMLA